MKSKGFTLIELLAIIVILAVIAVIAIPEVSKTIEDSRKNSTKDSAYGYKNAVHQYYLTNSASDSEFDLTGDFDISNGSIISGTNSYNISTDGMAPKSGNVTIEDGEIVDGCIDYGKYSIVIENGNVTDTVEGACYNISYFTYDENAEPGVNGYITNKLSTPDASWNYYVKEYEMPYKNSYYIYDISNNSLASDPYYPANIFSLNVCNLIVEDMDLGSDYECRAGTTKKYEFCGVENGNAFCLKTGMNTRNSNVDILDGIFDNCQYQTDSISSYSCYGDDVALAVYSYDNYTVGFEIFDVNDSSYYCSGEVLEEFSVASCSGPQSQGNPNPGGGSGGIKK